MKAPLKKFWNERNEREKKVLLYASLFLSASLLYAFVWLPGEKSIRRLAAEIPIMNSKLALMKSEALEIGKLGKRGYGFQGGIREAIEASARAADIPLKGASGQDHVAVEFAPVQFGKWALWAEKLAMDSRIRLESAHIAKLDEKGNVQIAAVFGRQP